MTTLQTQAHKPGSQFEMAVQQDLAVLAGANAKRQWVQGSGKVASTYRGLAWVYILHAGAFTGTSTDLSTATIKVNGSTAYTRTHNDYTEPLAAYQRILVSTVDQGIPVQIGTVVDATVADTGSGSGRTASDIIIMLEIQET